MKHACKTFVMKHTCGEAHMYYVSTLQFVDL
jgi:hypothetical protein